MTHYALGFRAFEPIYAKKCLEKDSGGSETWGVCLLGNRRRRGYRSIFRAIQRSFPGVSANTAHFGGS